MTYDQNDQRFASRINTQAQVGRARKVMVGIGVYQHEDPAQTLRQMDLVRRAGLVGWSIFSYTSFFRPPTAAADPASDRLRILRRQHILPRIRRYRTAL